jgi:hypothetical protein
MSGRGTGGSENACLVERSENSRARRQGFPEAVEGRPRMFSSDRRSENSPLVERSEDRRCRREGTPLPVASAASPMRGLVILELKFPARSSPLLKVFNECSGGACFLSSAQRARGFLLCGTSYPPLSRYTWARIRLRTLCVTSTVQSQFTYGAR